MPSATCARPCAATVLLLLAVLAPVGCASPPDRWRAGITREEDEPIGAPRPAAEVEVYYKDGFGPFAATERRRYFACATTTVLREAFVVPEELRGAAPLGEPERDYEVLGAVTTEEFPRDEAASRIHGVEFWSLFGVGSDPYDLFDVVPDPAFYPAALARLTALAAELGADAVIEVYATGEAEHHMWEGAAISFDNRSTSSPIFVSGKLLEFELRDVRLHGLAVRYED